MQYSTHAGFCWRKPLGLLFILLVFSAISFGVHADEQAERSPVIGSDSSTQVEQRLRAELRVLLMDMVQSGALSVSTGDPVSLVVESPPEQTADLGVLVDTRSGSVAERGLLVLGTTPGGMANRMGFRNGDVIVSLNDTSLAGLGNATDGSARAGRVLREALTAAEEGAQLSFNVLRDGESLNLVGARRSVQIPAFSLRVGSSASPLTGATVPGEQPTSDKGCGWINTFDSAPRQDHFHAAILISIDGEHTPLQGRSSYRVLAGRHVLKVGELIEERYLGFSHTFRDSGGGDRYKTLVVDVAPNTAYFLASRLNPESRNEWRDGKFWDPVIWKTKQENCR